MAGAAKAPDYAFRIGKERKFFIEAKKPVVNIKIDIEPAYQFCRYAWSVKLPLSILTDFEEFSVYDCQTQPDKKEKTATGHRQINQLVYELYDLTPEEITVVEGA